MTPNREGVLYALIVGCEVAFWVVLGAGLAIRYVMGRKRLSALVLLCVPLIDLALLAFTVIDLRSGTVARFAHGLAIAYVAFTVAFGSVVIEWADQWFAHWFAGAPKPGPAPIGWQAVAYELKLWGRCLLAVVIIYILLTAVLAFVDRPQSTGALQLWYRIPLGTALFWFLFGPVWSLVFFKREPSAT
jgi:hypothetical protein